MNKNDGGPAFPHPEYETKGMSLRDWFAGQAMQGFLASGCFGSFRSALAEAAYQCADAMLEKRNRQ